MNRVHPLERAIVLLIIALSLIAMALESDRQPPLLVGQTPASAERADWQKCVTIKPGPIKPKTPVNPFGRKDDVA